MKTSKLRIAVLVLLAILCSTLLSSNFVANAEIPTIKVGLFICYDQEFLDQDLDWWIFEGYRREVLFCSNRFMENFNIELVYDSTDAWILWDSDDELYYMDDLLEDAIEKLDFHSGEVRNGIRRDILLCFTGQDTNQLGFGYPVWNGSILRYYVPMGANSQFIQHELSHVFGLLHCDNDCVMNPTGLIFELPEIWCDECFQELNSNKFKYGVTLSIHASIGGTTNSASGTYQYDYAESATVTAIPDTDHIFDVWLLDGEDWIYDNPVTVTMDSAHTLKAYFMLWYGNPPYPVLPDSQNETATL